MKKWMKEENIHLDPHRKMQYLLLLAVCLTEALFISLEGMFCAIGYHVIEHYIAVPCFLFLGTLLGRKLNRGAGWNLGISTIAVAWFLLAQNQHRVMDMEIASGGMFFLSYLMAFPFASVMEDQEKNIGMKLAATLFLAASLVLVFYSVLLLLDCLPAYMQQFIYWDGTRLRPLWHSNIAACIFMIGIGTSLSYMFHTKKSWKRLLLTAAVVMQYVTLSLTNCRTSVMMTCVLIGFALFLAVLKWKKQLWMPAAAAALMMILISFAGATGIYEANQNWHREKALGQLQNVVSQSVPQDAEIGAWVPGESGHEAIAEYLNVEPRQADPQETYPPEIAEILAQKVTVVAPAETLPAVDAETVSVETTPETQALVEQETGEDQALSQQEEISDISLQGESHQGTWKDDLKTLNGRDRIWKAAVDALKNEKNLKWWGTEYVGLIISAYGYSQVEHSHNSWMEILMSLGIPGLVIAVIYTGIALWSAAVVLLKGTVEYWKKIIAVLILCVLVASFLEPFLFYTKPYYQFVDFIFFFFLGYLDLWRRQALHPEQFGA